MWTVDLSLLYGFWLVGRARGWRRRARTHQPRARVRARGSASMIALADPGTRLLVRPKDAHRFGVIERSTLGFPAADGRAGHPIE